MTTLDKKPRATLARLPLFQHWSRLLKLKTLFVGTTITEYAPLPAKLPPDKLLAALNTDLAGQASLVIIKDLPLNSPLLPAPDNQASQALAEAAARQKYMTVQGQALAYVAIDFASREEYLARLSASRRKDLTRKMKKRPLFTMEDRPFGDKLFQNADLLDEMYAMYLAVYNQSEIKFDLLSPEFFQVLLNSSLDGLVFMYWHDHCLAGYNICLIHQNMLIDKYIGFKYPLARRLNLYFLSWLENLDYARQNGCTTYIAGWTDPEVKASLGASFTMTRHLVLVRNPFLRALLRPLRPLFEADSHTLETGT